MIKHVFYLPKDWYFQHFGRVAIVVLTTPNGLPCTLPSPHFWLPQSLSRCSAPHPKPSAFHCSGGSCPHTPDTPPRLRLFTQHHQTLPEKCRDEG